MLLVVTTCDWGYGRECEGYISRRTRFCGHVSVYGIVALPYGRWKSNDFPVWHFSVPYDNWICRANPRGRENNQTEIMVKSRLTASTFPESDGAHPRQDHENEFDQARR